MATTTRSELLLERIRSDIVRNALPPGARLTEEALAERYGVSRTPVREVLRQLARESLLGYAPRIGYTVATVDLPEMDDLYTVRADIEQHIAQRIALDPGNPALEELLRFWEVPSDQYRMGDVHLVFADEHFHETLAETSGSAVFSPLLRNINQRLHVLRIRDFLDPRRVERTYEQHAAVARCLLRGDARLGAAILRAHIWESHAFVRESAERAKEIEVTG